VQATTTVLKEISVYPRPLQQPHPQVWEPLTSERSIRWAAQRGINGYFIGEPNQRLRPNIELYYAEAERQGWPDRLNRGRFKYGWDAEKHRGIITGRYVHIDRGGGRHERERVDRALELQWDYYGPFGFVAILSDPGEPLYDFNMKVTGDLLRQREILIDGSPAEVTEKILRIKEVCGYEDFMFNAWFELGGFAGEEVEEQMQLFAEEVMPALRNACGGGPNLPVSAVDLSVDGVRQGVS
jgi:alkanesulfonate monooxygenase SsuD/methylene tetrahydromethanopterin reductase-like flavin-dependent oxidoreductase (luciferase family)